MRDLSVAVRYMYTCTVIGEISNKKTRYTGFLSHHVIDILFSMKKSSVAVTIVMGHHY